MTLRAQRSVNASLPASARNVAPKALRTQATTLGRAMKWSRTAAAKTLYSANTANVAAMKTVLSCSICSVGWSR